MLRNYTIPANFGNLIKREKHKTCSLEESIRQHIFLILVTRAQANRFDNSYCCDLWRHDFDNSSASTVSNIRHGLEKSIADVLNRYEKRLSDVKVKIQITAESLAIGKFGTISSMKKKVALVVEGRIVETNQVFSPRPFIIYFSPIMLDSDGSF